MTTAEAAGVLEIRQAMWPNAVAHVDPETEIRVWAKILATYSVEHVLAAVEGFSGEFAPTLPQVRSALNPTPTYADALGEFRQMHARGYSSSRWSLVPWSHPLIAAFAEAHFAEWGMSPDGTADPAMVQSEAAARAHLRESFSAVQRRYVAGELGSGARPGIAPGRQIEGDRDERVEDVSVVRGSRTLGRDREDG